MSRKQIDVLKNVIKNAIEVYSRYDVVDLHFDGLSINAETRNVWFQGENGKLFQITIRDMTDQKDFIYENEKIRKQGTKMMKKGLLKHK